jgi:zinc transport system substrate-binding protein
MLSRIVLFSGAAVLAAVTVLAAGCGGSNSAGGKGKEIVAAFYPLAFAAEQITGGSAEVRNLTPAGAEPHDLELTPSDVRAVHDASLVLYLGDGFMPGLETAVNQRQGRSLDVLGELRQQAGYGGGAPGDPHVWLDPVRYAEMARLIGAALGKEAPAARLARRLDTLDGEYRRGLAHCKRRQIVTSHAAFGYLAARYGLEQIPLEGLTPEVEPSARDIARLVDVVRSSGATTVFFETLISPKLAETVAREAHAQTAVLDPLEGISKSEIAAGADYFSVMRANLVTLRKALGCTS